MNPAARHELQTLRDLIRYGVSRLNAAQVALGHGSDNAWDEAVYLTLHALHLPLDTLDPFLDARVLAEERERVLDLIDRRVTERVPAAYLTNEAWLRGHRFYVDARVIVPRSPIAELLDQGLTPWVQDPYAVEHVLDMCTGSGCLAILGALAFPMRRWTPLTCRRTRWTWPAATSTTTAWPSGWNCTRATCSTRCPRAATT